MGKKKQMTKSEAAEMVATLKSKFYKTAKEMGICLDDEHSTDRNFHNFMTMFELDLWKELKRNGVYEERDDGGDDSGNDSGNSGHLQLLPILLGTLIGTIVGNLLFTLARIIGIL